MNTPKQLQWNFDNLQVLVIFSLLGKGGGFLVKLVAAKAIRQQTFCFYFTLYHFLDGNLWSKKNDLIVLVHENHEKWPSTFLLLICKFFLYQKLDSVMCIFSEYGHLKRFVWKDNNIFAYNWKIWNVAHFPNWLWEMPSVDVQWQKNESVNIIIFFIE